MGLTECPLKIPLCTTGYHIPVFYNLIINGNCTVTGNPGSYYFKLK